MGLIIDISADFEKSVEEIKRFQETGNPYHLGRAIFYDVRLLTRPKIVRQIQFAIIGHKFSRSRESKSSLESFTKGMIPKAKKIPRKITEASFIFGDLEGIKLLHKIGQERITEQFKKDNPQDRTQRVHSLKKVIASKQKGRRRRPIFVLKQYEKWAEYSEPYDIAVLVTQAMLKRLANFDIGISNLKIIIKK